MKGIEGIMSKSKVYFTDFRTVAYGDGLPKKLQKLIKSIWGGDEEGTDYAKK